MFRGFGQTKTKTLQTEDLAIFKLKVDQLARLNQHVVSQIISIQQNQQEIRTTQQHNLLQRKLFSQKDILLEFNQDVMGELKEVQKIDYVVEVGKIVEQNNQYKAWLDDPWLKKFFEAYQTELKGFKNPEAPLYTPITDAKQLSEAYQQLIGAKDFVEEESKRRHQKPFDDLTTFDKQKMLAAAEEHTKALRAQTMYPQSWPPGQNNSQFPNCSGVQSMCSGHETHHDGSFRMMHGQHSTEISVQDDTTVDSGALSNVILPQNHVQSVGQSQILKKPKEKKNAMESQSKLPKGGA